MIYNIYKVFDMIMIVYTAKFKLYHFYRYTAAIILSNCRRRIKNGLKIKFK